MSENENVIEETNGMATLYSKMAAIAGGLGALPKDGEHKFHKYKYVTADTVSNAIRKLMAEQNLAFFVDMGNIEDSDGKYVIEFRFTFACGDTGATRSSVWFGEAQNTNSKGGIDDKALAKAATIAQKYFLMKTFNISTGDQEDTDANENGRDSTKRKPPAPKISEGTTRQVTMESREVATAKNGTDYNLFRTTSGEMIGVFSRQLFKSHGWCDDNDWEVVGEKESMNFTATITMKASGHWAFTTIPDFDPEFAAFDNSVEPTEQPALLDKSNEGDLGSDHYGDEMG